MDPDDPRWSSDPDDTASFSIPPAVRAPVGTALDDAGVHHLRDAGVLLCVGVVLLLVDVRAFVARVDLVPDAVGAVAVLLACLRLRRVAAVTGPARAASRALFLAVLNLLVVLPNDLPEVTAFARSASWTIPLDVAQVSLQLLGTAIVATIIARGHDALGQLGRRNRWMRTRRASLLLAAIWLPVGAVIESLGEEPTGLVGAVAGLLSLVSLVLAGITLVLLLRALSSTVNVRLQVGWGEA